MEYWESFIINILLNIFVAFALKECYERRIIGSKFFYFIMGFLMAFSLAIVLQLEAVKDLKEELEGLKYTLELYFPN